MMRRYWALFADTRPCRCGDPRCVVTEACEVNVPLRGETFTTALVEAQGKEGSHFGSLLGVFPGPA